MRVEIKLQPQFNLSIYFHFTQNQTSIVLRVGIKKPAQ